MKILNSVFPHFNELETFFLNKRALGPLTWEWLYIKVYESIAPLKVQLRILKDQQIHKDLTWVMLTKLTGCRTSTNKTSDIRGRAILAARGMIWTNFGRGSQDDVSNIIYQCSTA